MIDTFAHVIYRYRWPVLGAWLVLLVVAAGLTSQVGSVLGPGNFAIKNSESARAASILNNQFHLDATKVTLLVMVNRRESITVPSFQQAVARTASRIRADRSLRVAFVDNPLVSSNRQLIGRDGHSIALQVSSNLSEPNLEGQIDHLRSLVHSMPITDATAGRGGLHETRCVYLRARSQSPFAFRYVSTTPTEVILGSSKILSKGRASKGLHVLCWRARK